MCSQTCTAFFLLPIIAKGFGIYDKFCIFVEINSENISQHHENKNPNRICFYAAWAGDSDAR